MTPLVTVLIPTLGRPTLQKAAASVTAQTMECATFIMWDEVGIGSGPMLNRMLPHVKTRWVATMGDDDALEPTFAATVAKQDQDADLIIFQMRYADGKVLPTVTRPQDLTFGEVGCSYIVKTDVARQVGWMTEPGCEDWEMINQVRGRGLDVRIVPQVVYHIRPWEGQ